MGIKNSRFKFRRSTSPTFDPTTSEEEMELIRYLSDSVNDIDRHHMYNFFKKYLFQNNFSSPIEDRLIEGGCKTLDVGCGPGTWLLSVSSKYRDSQFFGLDTKPLFPLEIKPKNLKFIEADIFDGLPFPDNEFDFVHMESMILVITIDQWDFVLSELVRVTKQGGYIELVEAHVLYEDAGLIFHKLNKALTISCLKRNTDPWLAENLDSILELQPNVEEVHQDKKAYIFGPNGGKIGLVIQDVFLSFFTTEVAIKHLSDELGISKEEFKNMVNKDLVEELKYTKPEGYLIRYWTQKN